MLQAVLDVADAFGGNLLPEDVPSLGAIDQQTIAAPEECRVKGQGNGIGRNGWRDDGGRVAIKLATQRFNITPITLAQIIKRMPPGAVLLIGAGNPTLACRFVR